jgi:hypothetical protein
MQKSAFVTLGGVGTLRFISAAVNRPNAFRSPLPCTLSVAGGMRDGEGGSMRGREHQLHSWSRLNSKGISPLLDTLACSRAAGRAGPAKGKRCGKSVATVLLCALSAAAQNSGMGDGAACGGIEVEKKFAIDDGVERRIAEVGFGAAQKPVVAPQPYTVHDAAGSSIPWRGATSRFLL